MLNWNIFILFVNIMLAGLLRWPHIFSGVQSHLLFFEYKRAVGCYRILVKKQVLKK